MTDLQTGTGVSPLAIQAEKQWDAGDRPIDWQGHVYGLVVHTTGSGLPASADELGRYHTVRGVDHYSRSHGCHYLIGWAGAGGGDLLQLANEREEAHGVGVTNTRDPSKDQRRSIDAGRFEADLPAVLVRRWRDRWPGYEHSLALLPHTTANSCYVHVECVPCVYHAHGHLVTRDAVEPMRAGLRFTLAQHDTVAALATDIADRNGWPSGDDWWRTPRLLGHEDLTPISRHDEGGGWDPGYLRDEPYFDWPYVYRRIQDLLDGRPDQHGSEHRAIALARERRVTDVDELTNLLFFARHPEMGGRKIEAHEAVLAQEWIDIRDTIVRPTLNRLQSEPAP
jgi:N-acetyl-anhydromuramyl-L-alanine amidase AmpD